MESLLDKNFLKQLEQLNINAKKILLSKETPTKYVLRGGTPVEFKDYRSYSSGEDLRYVDWNVYARYEQLFIKQYSEEEHLHIYLIIDSSKSMEYGQQNKFFFAKKIAAGFAYISLFNFESVRIFLLSNTAKEISSASKEKAKAIDILKTLEDTKTSLPTHTQPQQLQVPSPKSGKSIIIFLSDFYFFDSLDYGHKIISSLKAERRRIITLQILSQEEIRPSLAGLYKISDIETNQSTSLFISDEEISFYRELLNRFQESFKNFCLKNDIGYYQTLSNEEFNKVILNILAREVIFRKQKF